MKTVSGKVVSSHPMSLSRAAKYLSTFTASPNEASAAAYLRRTSDAFNQLVQLHKHCGQHSNNLNNHNHDDVLTHATATSVAIVAKGMTTTTLDDDVNVVDHHSRYDSPSVGMDLNGGRIIEGDVSDVRSDLNKSKKKKNKKERDGDVATAEDTRGDDHDAIKALLLRNQRKRKVT